MGRSKPVRVALRQADQSLLMGLTIGFVWTDIIL
jgi:hypothetical protein